MFIDIISDVCLMYIRARVFINMDCANCMEQPLSNIQISMQEINNCINQKVNTNLYDTRK